MKSAVVPGPAYHLPSPGTAALQADVWAWTQTPSMEQGPLSPQAPRLSGERNPALTLQLWRAPGRKLQGLRQLLLTCEHEQPYPQLSMSAPLPITCASNLLTHGAPRPLPPCAPQPAWKSMSNGESLRFPYFSSTKALLGSLSLPLLVDQAGQWSWRDPPYFPPLAGADTWAQTSVPQGTSSVLISWGSLFSLITKVLLKTTQHRTFTSLGACDN